VLAFFDNELTSSLKESAKLLFTHVLGIKDITKTFEEIVPFFEESSEKEGTSQLLTANNEVVELENGSQRTMLRGWLEL
jgi:hypothetical protein